MTPSLKLRADCRTLAVPIVNLDAPPPMSMTIATVDEVVGIDAAMCERASSAPLDDSDGRPDVRVDRGHDSEPFLASRTALSPSQSFLESSTVRLVNFETSGSPRQLVLPPPAVEATVPA